MTIKPFTLRSFHCSRYILALCLSLSFACQVQAQVGERRNDFAIGLNGGLTLSSMDFVPKIKQGNKISPNFGFTARYVCEKYFATICAVMMEVDYANMGWKETIDDGTGNTYERGFSYVQVPLLMQLGWGKEQKGAKFVLEAGPQFGYWFSENEKRGGGEWNTAYRPNGVTYQYDHSPDNKFEYGIAAGAGLELSTSLGHFILVGRYYYGLGDVYDNSKKGYFGRSANQAIMVKLTYLYDLVKTKHL
ncbi:MAG: PorT family protein [Bacteroidaceae bacterium]|nr:PorT family protein [Bacteroidaceae bacterium]